MKTISDLLHAIDPLTLIGIIAAAAGMRAVEHVEILYRNPRVQIAALAHPAGTKIVDCIYTVVGVGGRVIEIWLLECDLTVDSTKRRRWSLYVVAFECELDADGELVVFSPVPKVRECTVSHRSRANPEIRLTLSTSSKP